MSKNRPISKSRLWGAALSLAGGALLAFVIWQSLDRAANDASIHTTGMPGSLLLGLVGIVALAFGLHRLTQRSPTQRPPSPPTRRR